jgi:hypothetical protein
MENMYLYNKQKRAKLLVKKTSFNCYYFYSLKPYTQNINYSKYRPDFGSNKGLNPGRSKFKKLRFRFQLYPHTVQDMFYEELLIEKFKIKKI